MKTKTMVLIGAAAVVGFLYLRRGAAAAPAVVNAGTAAPVGNTATGAAGTTNSQTASGSEAGYAMRPLAKSPFSEAAGRASDIFEKMMAELRGKVGEAEAGTGP